MALGPNIFALKFMAFGALALMCPAAAIAPYKVIFHLGNLERGKEGHVVVEVHPEWAPKAAERFAELLEQRFFDNNLFFRVVCGFVAQFGIAADPKMTASWKGKTLEDDPQLDDVSNNRGRLSFVTDGKDDRSTQIAFNIKDNEFLDNKNYVPFAEVTEGMFFIDRIYNKYGGKNRAPDQSMLEAEGNSYAAKDFPHLTYIKSVEIVKAPSMFASLENHHWLAAGGVFIVTVAAVGWFSRAGVQTSVWSAV